MKNLIKLAIFAIVIIFIFATTAVAQIPTLNIGGLKTSAVDTVINGTPSRFFETKAENLTGGLQGNTLWKLSAEQIEIQSTTLKASFIETEDIKVGECAKGFIGVVHSSIEGYLFSVPASQFSSMYNDIAEEKIKDFKAKQIAEPSKKKKSKK